MTPSKPGRISKYAEVLMFIRFETVWYGECFSQFVNKVTVSNVNSNSYDLPDAIQYIPVLL